jgi:hypothetical protein
MPVLGRTMHASALLPRVGTLGMRRVMGLAKFYFGGWHCKYCTMIDGWGSNEFGQSGIAICTCRSFR